MPRKSDSTQNPAKVNPLAEPSGQFRWTDTWHTELDTFREKVRQRCQPSTTAPWVWAPFPVADTQNWVWSHYIATDELTQLLTSSPIVTATREQDLPTSRADWALLAGELFRKRSGYSLDPRADMVPWMLGAMQHCLGLETCCDIFRTCVEQVSAQGVDHGYQQVLPPLIQAIEHADEITRQAMEPMLKWLQAQPLPADFGLRYASLPEHFADAAARMYHEKFTAPMQLLAIERFGAQGSQLLKRLIQQNINFLSGFGIGQETVRKSDHANVRKVLNVWMAYDDGAVLDVLIAYPADPFLLKFTEQLILRWPVWAIRRIVASKPSSNTPLVSLVCRLLQEHPTWATHLQEPDGSNPPSWLVDALAKAENALASAAQASTVGDESGHAQDAALTSDTTPVPDDLPPLLRQPPWRREKKPTAKEKIEQPWLKLPTRLPALPLFLATGLLPPPRLKVSDQPLPPAALEALLTMFAISKPGAPYAGLALVLPALESGSLAALGTALQTHWERANCPLEERWMLLTQAWTADNSAMESLVNDIGEWPSQMAFPRAKFGLSVLADMAAFQRRDEPLRALIRFAEKGKSSLRKPAREQISKAAEAMGLSPEQLGDRLIPDLGLQHPENLIFNLGSRHFRLHFDESAQPFLKNEQGLRQKDLPKPNAQDNAHLATQETKRWKTLKKLCRTVVSEQIRRLEWALASQRTWSAAEFARLFRQHPMLRELARRLLWSTQEDAPRRFRLSEDYIPVDLDDAPVSLDDTSWVTLTHPMELEAAERDAWLQIWNDYELLQPFEQLTRQTYRLDPDTPQVRKDVPSVRDQPVAAGSLLGLIQQGWEKLQDGANIYGLRRDIAGETAATLMLHDGLNVALPLSVPVLHIRSLELSPALSPQTCSEMLRTVDRLARA